MRFLLFWGAVLVPVAVAASLMRPRVSRGDLARGLLFAMAPVAVWVVAVVVGGRGRGPG